MKSSFGVQSWFGAFSYTNPLRKAHFGGWSGFGACSFTIIDLETPQEIQTSTKQKGATEQHFLKENLNN